MGSFSVILILSVLGVIIYFVSSNSGKATPSELKEAQMRLLDLYKPLAGDSKYVAEKKEETSKFMEEHFMEYARSGLRAEKSGLEHDISAARSMIAGFYKSNEELKDLVLVKLEAQKKTRESALNVLKNAEDSRILRSQESPEMKEERLKAGIEDDPDEDEDMNDLMEKLVESSESKIKESELEVAKYV